MWQRHRWMMAYAAVGFVALFAVAVVAGFDEVSAQIAIGIGGTTVAVASTTNYRVLAQTVDGIYLFRASRIRRVAVELAKRFIDGVDIRAAGGTILAGDWDVAGVRYTVPKSGETAMHRIAQA